ncbi:MAG: dapH [Holophagaceae bacterium]|nr:dapH [Holophagaceae bacterium]
MGNLLIIGAGGHGKVVADIARDSGRWEEIAFLDDNYPDSIILGLWKVRGKTEESKRFLKQFPEALVAIGANAVRLATIRRLTAEGFQVPTLIHPDASVSRLSVIGAGSVICAQSAIKIDTTIGMGAIINAGATIAHDCTLADGVHISPGGRISGDVQIGECTWLGSGAIIKEQVTIGHHVIIGAGSVVIRDVPDGVKVVGIPGRIIPQTSPNPPTSAPDLTIEIGRACNTTALVTQ